MMVGRDARAFGMLLAVVTVIATYAWPAFALDAAGTNAIIRDLAPIAGQSNGQSRPARETVEVAGRSVLVDPGRRFEQDVFFDPGSASLTPRAMAQLRALGLALSSSTLAPYRFVVAGHTDAVGSDGYNADLSLRRAAAVRDYLSEAFPVDPRRLVAVGFGSRRLKRPEFPRAAVNRRVEILTIADQE